MSKVSLRSLSQTSYHGITLKKDDPNNQGRYLVHIPELHPLIEQEDGIWCKNHTHKWRYNGCDEYLYGEYKPLQPGSFVLVRFYEEDLNTGYIDRIVSDQIKNCLLKLKDGGASGTTDRDDMYLIYKTPKKHNLFVVLEDTKGPGLNGDLIPNSIHFYYNELRTTLIINEDGIHWYTEDNRGVTVKKDNNELVHKNERIQVNKSRQLFVGMTNHQTVGISKQTTVGLTRKDMTFGKHTISSFIKIDLAAPIVKIGGKPSLAIPAKSNKGEDHSKKQNKLKQKTTPSKTDKLDPNLNQ